MTNADSQGAPNADSQGAPKPKATHGDLMSAYELYKSKQKPNDTHQVSKKHMRQKVKEIGCYASPDDIDSFIASLLNPAKVQITYSPQSQPVAQPTGTTTKTQPADKKITTSKKRRIRRNKCVAWHKKQASLAQQKNQLVAIKN